MSDVIPASDHQCAEDGCEERADVWWGMADPDMTQTPLCARHADQWTAELWLELGRMR